MPKREALKLGPEGERVYARLASDVAREITRALNTEHGISGITRAGLARLIGRDKSFVTRKLSGENVQIRTVAALLGALGYELDVKANRIEAPPEAPSNHPAVTTVTSTVIAPALSRLQGGMTSTVPSVMVSRESF